MKLSNRLLSAMLALALIGALAVTGCTTNGGETEPSGEATSTGEAKAAPIKIGTLATQDALPLWVAEDSGYFKAEGLDDVEIITFQSAQEEQVAFSSGTVDALMTDLIVSANVRASGMPVKVATIMLGADTTEGRFAVVAAPKSGIKTMADLKGVPVGTASATITEYVLDKLAEEGGLAASDVKKEEIKKMPVRFQLLMAGKVKAASLPEPFVTLAEQSGATIVEGGDDTKAAENISQSVLAVNGDYAASEDGGAALAAVLRAWNTAVVDINDDPNAFRQTLVDQARLPAPLATTYPVSTYPLAAPPSVEMVQSVLDWMQEKGYLKATVTPQDLLGE
ncbi:MAG TPA: ABC transporter substrate-binding protein [Coriobacteriia bacterium]|nr:ABC transporter substrate-binding protein [Coriobacteriia bacterium]